MTLATPPIDGAGPTDAASVAFRDVPPEPMRHRNFRLDDETWFAASRIAAIKGQRISDVMRDLARNYVTRHKRLLADDVRWAEYLRTRDPQVLTDPSFHDQKGGSES